MPSNSLIVKVLRGEKTERIPVWFMRQAGRYLPEYRELRSKHRMLDLIRSPELAAEVTLQPMRRFDLDAAIIFADILNPLMGMGVDLDFVEGHGPKIFNPIVNSEDIKKLTIPDPQESLSYTLEAIKTCVKELAPQGKPVLGFAGAPFTLSCYLIEGGSLGQVQKTKTFMLKNPQAWHELQEKLVALVSSYLVAQIKAGVSAVQLFDSWVGFLARSEYETFVLPYVKKIFAQVKKETSAPLVYFSTGTSAVLDIFAQLGISAISIDWRTDLQYARRILGEGYTIQGNLDPIILAGPREYLEKQVIKKLSEGKQIGKYIFNLGHGIIPETPPENVAAVIKLVREHGLT